MILLFTFQKPVRYRESSVSARMLSMIVTFIWSFKLVLLSENSAEFKLTVFSVQQPEKKHVFVPLLKRTDGEKKQLVTFVTLELK